MNKPGLLRRLAQPRKLAAVFAAVAACGVVIASPAEARRHTYVSHHAHRGGGDEVIGEHRGFAAIVVDANSGRTLYSRNENELRHPASVTKVMTLYLLFEQLEKGRMRLDTPLMISSHAAMQAPSKLGLAPGETISVENAIKALVTKSANDIACAVAAQGGQLNWQWALGVAHHCWAIADVDCSVKGLDQSPFVARCSQFQSWHGTQ